MQCPQPEGFLAIPSSGTGRGVLVLHPWWGLNDTIKVFCTRLAGAGFVALAPDLFHGEIATTIEQAEHLSRTADDETVKADVAGAVDTLLSQAAVVGRKIAVIGFSFGAYYALGLSASDTDRVSAVVAFYGTGPADFGQSKSAYLGHFAELDPYEPADNVDWLEGALREAGRPATFYRYPGTGHWFFEPDRVDAYNEAAASLAWERTLTFLNHHLSL